jgi:hypothetical protein
VTNKADKTVITKVDDEFATIADGRPAFSDDYLPAPPEAVPNSAGINEPTAPDTPMPGFARAQAKQEPESEKEVEPLKPIPAKHSSGDQATDPGARVEGATLIFKPGERATETSNAVTSKGRHSIDSQLENATTAEVARPGHQSGSPTGDDDTSRHSRPPAHPPSHPPAHPPVHHHRPPPHRDPAAHKADVPESVPKWAAPVVAQFLALPRRAQILVGGGAVFALILMLMVLFSPRRQPQTMTTPVGPHTQQLVDDAKRALAQHNFDSAIGALEAVHGLEPNNAEANSLLDQAKKGKAEQSIFDRASRDAEGKRFDEARAGLQAIPANSIFAADAKALLGKVDTEVAQAQAALDSTAAAAADGGAVAEGDNPSTPKPTVARPSASASASESAELKPVMHLFETNPEQAAAQFEKLSKSSKNASVRTRAQSLATQAKACASAQANAEKPAAGVKDLHQAFDRCAEVSPDGALAHTLKDKLVDLLHQKTQEALAGDDKVKAAQLDRELLTVEPKDSGARQGLDQLLKKAHEIYLSAYVTAPQNPDEAAKQFKEVLGILTPQDADYAKAKAKLAEIGPVH